MLGKGLVADATSAKALRRPNEECSSVAMPANTSKGDDPRGVIVENPRALKASAALALTGVDFSVGAEDDLFGELGYFEGDSGSENKEGIARQTKRCIRINLVNIEIVLSS